jgi:hypothetical protein
MKRKQKYKTNGRMKEKLDISKVSGDGGSTMGFSKI